MAPFALEKLFNVKKHKTLKTINNKSIVIKKTYNYNYKILNVTIKFKITQFIGTIILEYGHIPQVMPIVHRPDQQDFF